MTTTSMIGDFKRGILTRDINLVKRALDGGINPATPVSGLHPLMMLLGTPYEEHPIITTPRELRPHIKNKDDFKRSCEDIVNLLLDCGVKLVEENRYVSNDGPYLIDSLLVSRQPVGISSLAIHALHESLTEKGEAWEPNAAKVASSFAVYHRGTKSEAKDFLDGVYEAVWRRLAYPETAIEKEIVTKHKEKINHWLEGGQKMSAETDTQTAEKPDQSGVKILVKKSPQKVLAEMDELVGMTEAKRDARSLMLRAQFDAARADVGLPEMKQVLHTAFLGNPGTGKTTLARLRAELLHSLGLAGNRYIEISRESMVGKYIGHTEKNMLELFEKADVIFIDEAYNLAGDKDDKKDFGNRVVDALMTALENRRDDLVVFFAGYPEQMKEFLSSNPGLQSRVTHYQTLPDYTSEEMGQILDRNLGKARLTIEPEARDYALAQLAAIKEATGSRDFGNARIIRTLVEQVPNKMAERLFSQTGEELTSKTPHMPAKEDLSTVKKADVEALKLASTIQTSPFKRGIGFTAQLYPVPA